MCFFPYTNKTFCGQIFAVLLLTACNALYSQSERANNWAFPVANGLNFNVSPRDTFGTASITFSAVGGSTSTISDLDGNLLFYSNGASAWDRNHQLMPNGAGLVGDAEATQTSIIIPYPNSPSRYFLFTQDHFAGSGGLSYYMIDMTFNAGFGDIVSPAQLLQDTMTGKLCATKHANNFDYWVVGHQWDSDSFYAWKVDSFGVNATPVISEAGLRHFGNFNGTMGQMKISPDGKRLALACFSRGFVQLFDFDPETGVVSNALTLVNYLSNFPMGIEFSPDSRKLYYTQRFSGQNPTPTLFQFDLDHLDPECLIDSKHIVAEMNPLKVPSSLQLGTDGKIYMGVNYFPSYDSLSIIPYPNLYGDDCGFEELGLQTPSTVYEGLTGFVSTYVSDGIHVVFGTTCDNEPTWMYPQDSLGLDSVRWDFGDPSSAANTSTLVYTSHLFSAPDTFHVTLYTYQGNDVDTFFRNVIIWDTALNLLGADTTICNSGSVTLTADWYNACLEWSTSATTSSISVNAEGWYWVDVNYQSCYFRDSVFVEVVSQPPQFDLGDDTLVCSDVNFILDPDLANAYYTWQNGSHDTTFNVTSTGVYWLTASNACGTSVDTIDVILNPSPQLVLDFPEDTVVCDTNELTLDVTLDDAAYEWSDGSTASIKTIDEPGTYWVEIGTICDTVADTITVYFNSPLESAFPDYELLCGNDTLTLYATQDSALVTWSTGNTDSVEAFSSPGKFWYSTSNACGILSDSLDIFLWDSTYHIDLGRDTIICSENILFTLGDTSGTDLLDYEWSDGSNTPTIDVYSGIYSITATNKCVTLTDTRVVSIAAPVTILELSDHNICENEHRLVSLDQLDLPSVTWSSGDTTPAIEITQPGTYHVEVIDSNGCTFHDTVSFTNVCPGKVFICNVFTPNADGVNDKVCPELANVSSFLLTIYNRWGQEVFQTNDLESCWDGHAHSSPANPGTYFYILEGEDNAGKSFVFRGDLTLIR